jgi:hypothetical protein
MHKYNLTEVVKNEDAQLTQNVDKIESAIIKFHELAYAIDRKLNVILPIQEDDIKEPTKGIAGTPLAYGDICSRLDSCYNDIQRGNEKLDKLIFHLNKIV